jgi:type I restriction enzyme S subunit
MKEFPKAEPLCACYVLSVLDLKKFDSGAAVPTLNQNHINGLVAPIPLRLSQTPFREVAEAMHVQTRTLKLQIQKNRRTRNLLLPRLLSGQVELETEVA